MGTQSTWGVSTQRSLKMRLIWTSLALVLASLWHVQGYTCPPGKSKKTITLGVGESVDFSTQDADSYGKNVKCVVKFKKAKKAKCELNFSCSAFTLTAKNSNCNRGSDFLKIGKEKFCEDNSPDVTVAGRTLNVLFRSNKRSKGGEGAECEATCVDPDDEAPTTVAPPATTPPTPVTTAAPTTVCASCSLLTHWGDTNSLDHITGDIFAIWWEKKYDHEEDARALLSTLSQIRTECLLNLGMADPPNPGRGNFYNVYIHHKEDDLFPSGWALGQGTDESRNPYLTVPFGSLGNKRIWHEGFHIFQYSASSPGFEYRGDSMWYIEASAQWYMAQKTPHERDTYVEAGAIVGNPQLALWHSFSNEAPGDFGSTEGRPGWMYGVRQYGMHTLLTYLTEVAGIDKDIVTAGVYANTELSPQEYIKSRVGSTVFQRYFADWAGHNCANMDYLTREQYERGLLEISLAGDWSVFRPSVWEGVNQGTNGWVSPPEQLAVRGWAYNVWNVTNSEDAVYTFQLEGEAAGSEGGKAQFEGRVVVIQEDGGSRHQAMAMESDVTGEAQVAVQASDLQVILAVVSVPDDYGSYQTYPYRAKITRN